MKEVQNKSFTKISLKRIAKKYPIGINFIITFKGLLLLIYEFIKAIDSD